MRILWVDADQNPWTDKSGWKTMDDFGVSVRRFSTVPEAKAAMATKEYDAILVRAEMAGAQELLEAARRLQNGDQRRIILTSSVWKKEEFKAHSKTAGAAHRYARVPMPPEGFLNLLADVFAIGIDELRDFVVAEIPEAPPAPSASRPARSSYEAPRITQRSSHADSEDVDVLRKYLRLKEEQLAIAEGNREELLSENERVRRDAQELQLKLREFEHLHDELAKKIEAMESDRQEMERNHLHEKESYDHQAKVHSDRVKNLESQLGEANEKYENLRVRVRKDIRKIRSNERDLEARLELMRKDSETLLQARDHKVLDLQRKIDALEFDLDQIQDSRVQAQMEAERYLAKLARVSRALQIAISMIEADHSGEDELDALEPILGGAAEEAKIADDSGEGQGGTGGSGGSAAPSSTAPAGAEPPPPDALNAVAEAAGAEGLSPDLAALANDGEPTRMVNLQQIENNEGES